METYHGRSRRERLHVLDNLSRNWRRVVVMEGASSVRLVGLVLNKLRLEAMYAICSGQKYAVDLSFTA
jgi:hypothetical protein